MVQMVLEVLLAHQVLVARMEPLASLEDQVAKERLAVKEKEDKLDPQDQQEHLELLDKLEMKGLQELQDLQDLKEAQEIE